MDGASVEKIINCVDQGENFDDTRTAFSVQNNTVSCSNLDTFSEYLVQTSIAQFGQSSGYNYLDTVCRPTLSKVTITNKDRVLRNAFNHLCYI